MQMWWASRSANPADLLATPYTIAGAQNDTGGVEMAVERKDVAVVRKDVPHDDDTFVGTPSQWCRIGNRAMPDAVNRRAKAWSSSRTPPVFTRMVSILARSEYAKVPTPEELNHDYLWRVHRHTPGKGEIVIFNRSHYEDVLVVRVKDLVPKSVWRRRYRHIKEFERVLADEGTTILKFFLNIYD